MAQTHSNGVFLVKAARHVIAAIWAIVLLGVWVVCVNAVITPNQALYYNSVAHEGQRITTYASPLELMSSAAFEVESGDTVIQASLSESFRSRYSVTLYQPGVAITVLRADDTVFISGVTPNQTDVMIQLDGWEVVGKIIFLALLTFSGWGLTTVGFYQYTRSGVT